MAIKINKVSTKSKRALEFKDLNCGDIFIGSMGNWYMKIYSVWNDCGDLMGNAIRLENGRMAIFDETETVKKLKKDLTVDYSNDDITEWYED